MTRTFGGLYARRLHGPSRFVWTQESLGIVIRGLFQFHRGGPRLPQGPSVPEVGSLKGTAQVAFHLCRSALDVDKAIAFHPRMEIGEERDGMRSRVLNLKRIVWIDQPIAAYLQQITVHLWFSPYHALHTAKPLQVIASKVGDVAQRGFGYSANISVACRPPTHR